MAIKAENMTEVAVKNNKIIIKSRFGEIEVDTDKAIYFPEGIYGLASNINFALMDFKQERLAGFQFLQCLEDNAVSIPVVSLPCENKFHDSEDIKQCLDLYSFAQEDCILLLVASSRKDESGNFIIKANVKAPIIVNVAKKEAYQHIFTNNKYEISQRI